jgi:hypothetical protein
MISAQPQYGYVIVNRVLVNPKTRAVVLTQGETRKTKRVRLFTEFSSRRLAAAGFQSLQTGFKDEERLSHFGRVLLTLMWTT